MANREPVLALSTLKKHLFASIQFYLRKCFILIGQAAFTTEHGHFLPIAGSINQFAQVPCYRSNSIENNLVGRKSARIQSVSPLDKYPLHATQFFDDKRGRLKIQIKKIKNTNKMSLLLLMFNVRTPWKIADTIVQNITTIFSVIIILSINGCK